MGVYFGGLHERPLGGAVISLPWFLETPHPISSVADTAASNPVLGAIGQGLSGLTKLTKLISPLGVTKINRQEKGTLNHCPRYRVLEHRYALVCA